MVTVKPWLARAMTGIAVVLPCAAQAQSTVQNYPTRFVKFVITYPAGGSSDVMSRIVGQKLTEYWGQQVILEFKPGADGVIGMEYAAKQPADGYTFLLGNFGPVVAKPVLSKVNYSWQKDFAPVSLITQASNILVVPVNSPFKSTQDIISAARAQPGKLTFGGSGIGSMAYFAGEMFKYLTELNLTLVNYKGHPPAMVELIGGQISLMFSDALPAMQNMKAGRLRGLAVTSETRWSYTPDLPTLAEEGVKGFAAKNWWGILFPAGVPRPVIDKVSADVGKALATNEVKTRLAELAVEAISSTPEEFAKFMTQETERWGKLAREAGLKVE